uniref:Uncharacterized protein n=1 Tax=Rhizophora mucronata TaxID=61149 RepID=A0A2P2KXV8_RHIMU
MGIIGKKGTKLLKFESHIVLKLISGDWVLLNCAVIALPWKILSPSAFAGTYSLPFKVV